MPVSWLLINILMTIAVVTQRLFLLMTTVVVNPLRLDRFSVEDLGTSGFRMHPGVPERAAKVTALVFLELSTV